MTICALYIKHARLVDSIRKMAHATQHYPQHTGSVTELAVVTSPYCSAAGNAHTAILKAVLVDIPLTYHTPSKAEYIPGDVAVAGGSGCLYGVAFFTR